MKKAIRAAILAVVFTLALASTASSLDRTTWYYSQNPTSQQTNYQQRQARVAFGELIHMMMGGTSGFYYNLSIIPPASGLTVTVQPTTATTVGAVYQYLPEEATSWGGAPTGPPGSTALGIDATQTFLQGILAPTTFAADEVSPSVGPLTPPGTGGQSVDYVIECKVQTSDANSQTITTVSTSGIATQVPNINRDRVDTIACQAKAGTPASTGSQLPPVTDAGWVCVGYVVVANGQTDVVAGNITPFQPYLGMTQAAPYGYAKLSPNGFQSGLTAVTTGSCSTATVCALSSGATVNFAATAASAPACHGTVATPTGAIVVVPHDASTASVGISFYNLTGGSITTGTTITYSLVCETT